MDFETPEHGSCEIYVGRWVDAKRGATAAKPIMLCRLCRCYLLCICCASAGCGAIAPGSTEDDRFFKDSCPKDHVTIRFLK